MGRTETQLGIKLAQLEDYILELIFGTEGQGHKAEKNLVKQEKPKNFIKIDIYLSCIKYYLAMNPYFSVCA